MSSQVRVSGTHLSVRTLARLGPAGRSDELDHQLRRGEVEELDHQGPPGQVRVHPEKWIAAGLLLGCDGRP
jgi:hypothetical protein